MKINTKMDLKVTYEEKVVGEIIKKSFITHPRYNESFYQAQSRIMLDLLLDEYVISAKVELLQEE